MARVPIHLFFVFASFHLRPAHSSSSEKGRLEVEIGREGQVLMRQSGTKVQTIDAAEQDLDVQVGKPRRHVLDRRRPKEAVEAFTEVGKPRRHVPERRHPKEAVEAFTDPHKIDDSWFASVGVPPFIEKYPYFYASSFVGASVMLLFGVCFYVQYEDYKEAQKGGRIRRARTQAAKAASAVGQCSYRLRASPDLKAKAEAAAVAAARKPHDMKHTGLSNAAFSEAAVPATKLSNTARSAHSEDKKKRDQEVKDFKNSKPKDAMARHMEKAARPDGVRSAGAPSSSARFRPSSPPLAGPRAMVGQAAAAAAQQGVQGMLKLSDAVGNFTGVLAGENTKMPEFSSPFASTSLFDATTASGTSTPRSQLSSQQPSLRSEVHGPAIRNGTVLATRVPEVIFASTTSWQEIGKLSPGQRVVAAAPPEEIGGYMMVLIKPKGAVDLKTFEVQHEY